MVVSFDLLPIKSIINQQIIQSIQRLYRQSIEDKQLSQGLTRTENLCENITLKMTVGDWNMLESRVSHTFDHNYWYQKIQRKTLVTHQESYSCFNEKQHSKFCFSRVPSIERVALPVSSSPSLLLRIKCKTVRDFISILYLFHSC